VSGDDALVGAFGVLTVATRGQAGPGEVLVKIRGGSETFLAWSPEPLPKGTSVLVIESRGRRTVDVSQWDDPLGPFPGGAAGEQDTDS
jgi:membrane protein implicated in regulation of membrane protease activity